MTNISPFNSDWFFVKKPVPATLQDIVGEDTGFTPVTLPPDWLIYDTKNLYQSMEGWYYKTFNLTDINLDTRYVLRFEGVYMNFFYCAKSSEFSGKQTITFVFLPGCRYDFQWFQFQ